MQSRQKIRFPQLDLVLGGGNGTSRKEVGECIGALRMSESLICNALSMAVIAGRKLGQTGTK